MDFIRVRNFDRFQHYRDRAPPWIKLYNELLDDYDFACLQDASKMHLIGIWLLASRTENKIPADPKWIGKRISATEKVDLSPLLAAGFIERIQELQNAEQLASETLADRQQNACPEGEGEREERQRESRAERETDGASAPRSARGSRLPADWEPPDDWLMWCTETLGMQIDAVTREADVFRDYWIAQPGQKGVKTDWGATFRNWMRRAAKETANGKPARQSAMAEGFAIASRLLEEHNNG